jgi:hypothetical protein
MDYEEVLKLFDSITRKALPALKHEVLTYRGRPSVDDMPLFWTAWAYQ